MSIKFLSVGLGSYLLTLGAPAIALGNLSQGDCSELSWLSILSGGVLCILLLLVGVLSAFVLARLAVRFEKVSFVACLLPTAPPIFIGIVAWLIGSVIGWTALLATACMGALVLGIWILSFGVVIWASD
jgi:ABC-type glycerol-3-phosphate transport system permease component